MRNARQAKGARHAVGAAACVAALAGVTPAAASSPEGAWRPVGGALAGPLAGGKGAVKALAVFDERLVVAGLIARAGETDVGNVAAWDGEGWDVLGGGTDRPVDALVVAGDRLIAGGSFRTAGDIDASAVAAWNGDRWAPLGAGVDGWVAALHVHDGTIVAAGDFHTAGVDSARRIAAWTDGAWVPVGAGLGAGPRPPRRRGITTQDVVYALTTFEGDLVAGGTFGTAGGVPVTNVARWDGTAWHPLGAGLDGEVRVFTTYEGRLVAGGKFRASGDTTVNHIATWDGTAWQPLASRLALEPGLGRWVFALEPDGHALLAGGCFVEIGTEDAEFLATWDGGSWRPIATGLDHCVSAIARWRGDLYLGGSFDQAGYGPCRYLVRWSR